MAQHKSFSPLCARDLMMFGAVGAFLCGLAAASSPAVAQAASASPQVTEQVTVRAPSYVVRRVPISGRQTRLMNAEVISVSRAVNYADLDLSKPSDATELEKRINDTARDVCREVNVLTPKTTFVIVGGQDCVKSATDDAMGVAKQLIAATK